MWKTYIEIIKERDINYNYQEYCLWFSCHFSYEIIPLKDFINIIEYENGDLLPIYKNLTNYFYSHSLEFMINLIYHLNDLKNLDFIIMDNSITNNIESLFSSRHNKLYFLNLFSFDTELLLSSENNSASLLFLFLYFFPNNKNQDLLYHSKKNIPLISCNKVSFTQFEMLLFLMKNFNTENYKNLCDGYNLNLILIEDFCQSANEIYTFLDKDDWYKILPIQKIKVLFKEKCHLNNFLYFQNKKIYYIVPTLTEFITYFQKELDFLHLQEKLTTKNQLNYKEKIVKI